MIQTYSHARRLPLGGFVLVLVFGWLTGCVTYPAPDEPPVLRHHGPVGEAPAVDVLALSPAMRAFLERWVLPYESPDTRLDMLVVAVSDPAMLGFRYRDDLTLTASEAFELRAGNCIGFANLMVALARAAGLEANYQQISLQPQWTSKEDTLLVAKHVNVRIRAERHAKVVDSSGLDTEIWRASSPVSDAEAHALYYTNLGAEALIRNELHDAYARFLRAIETAPRLPDPWINLGVTYSRNGQPEAAARAYRTALGLDRSENAALANLYELYVNHGAEREARRLAHRVERYRQRNPYYLLKLSEDALAEGRVDDSYELLERALEIKDNEHQFYFALARTRFLDGDTDGAQASLERARELAPDSKLAFYNRPMSELVLEEP